MRIAHVSSSLLSPLGGAEQYCLALAGAQVRRGHDVTVVTGWVDDGARALVAATGARLVVVPGRRPYSPDRQGTGRLARVRFHAAELRDSLRPTAITRFLEDGGFDAVHVHRFSGFGAAPFRLAGPRVVHTAHDFTLVHTSASLTRGDAPIDHVGRVQGLRSRVVAAAIPRDATLIFPSERTRDRHAERGFRLDAHRSTVLPHGWSAPRDAPPRSESDVLRVLFLGKLAEHKGIPLLLEAWGAGVPGATLTVGGDGPLRDAVSAADAVVAAGWLDEAGRARALAETDLLVMPSRWAENFPIVVAEALLAGVPVLTTTTASPPLVVDGDSGLVVPPTAAALRGAIERLVDDRALRAALRAGATRRAEELDMDRHVDRVLEHYGASA
ncbi:hypothetical protein DEI82_10510 [Curtobacterium sp. MCBD17_019]|nr:hypothetical protein DEI86_01115 [Curtobacterium sp. MCBD17_028]PZE74464.1 hypothetical protein DEI82_10510 [Curtobacterium sp. MCBD17_019]